MRLNMTIVGAGTMGAEATKQIAIASRTSVSLEGLTIIDHARVRELNWRTTCPEYANETGHWKVDALRRVVSSLGVRLPIRTIPRRVEQVDWRNVFKCIHASSRNTNVVLLALDDWQARIMAMTDLRAMAPSSSSNSLVVMAALDKGLGQVSVFGNQFDDPCVMCPLHGHGLPPSEPCALFSADGNLARGNLKKERQVTASLVVQILGDWLRGDQSWLNTKSLLIYEPSKEAFNRNTERKSREPHCTGPHDPNTAPLSLAEFVGHEFMKEGEYANWDW